jgi:hypothetical protein
MIHDLKILPQYFDAVKEGSKTFEVRRDDRPFNVGDVLRLHEFNGQELTGREFDVKISYILRDAEYCKEGYCTLGIQHAEKMTNADKIRWTTDDEKLLEVIGTACFRCKYRFGGCNGYYMDGGCIEGNLEWLKEEAQEDVEH